MKKVSLADLATSLGVSKTLVSMVLNGKGDINGISAETQEKVKAKAKELKYKPNQFARGLRIGKSYTIGLIVADISNPFYAKIARSIEDNANKYGFNLIICSSDENPEKEADLIQMLKDRRVDGLIFSSTQENDEEILQLQSENYPFVLIDRNSPRVDTNYVIVDNYQGAFDAVDYLVKDGNGKVALLTISPSYLTSLSDRKEGYVDALKKNGIKFDDKLVKEVSFDDLKITENKDLEKWLKSLGDVKSIFAVNNNLAVACLQSIRNLNDNMLEDINIVSFDDLDLFNFCNPPITSIAQPIEEICSKTVDILINEIENKDDKPEKQNFKLSTEIIIRK